MQGERISRGYEIMQLMQRYRVMEKLLLDLFQGDL